MAQCGRRVRCHARQGNIGAVAPGPRGVELNDDDLIRRDVIQKLMCNFELDFATLGAQYSIPFAEYFAPDLAPLAPFATDGLVMLTECDLKLTLRGRLLVRTVAMHFDRCLREAQQKAQYSRVV